MVNQSKMNKYKLATLEQHSRIEIQLLLSTLLSLYAPPTVNCVFKKNYQYTLSWNAVLKLQVCTCSF